MCVSYRSRYNTLSNIRFPTAPKNVQEIFRLVIRKQVIRSPERVSNEFALDLFMSHKPNGQRDEKANII